MITVILLVVTLVIPDRPGATHVVNAAQPFFRTLIECQQAARGMQSAPRIVEEIRCEYHQLDVSTGRVVK